jgi:hypothetical protein
MSAFFISLLSVRRWIEGNNDNNNKGFIIMHSQQIERVQSFRSNTSSCGSGRSSILDDLLFSNLAEHNDKETPPIRRPSRRALSPSSIKRSLQERRESWAVCDWDVMEKECYSDSSSEEETDEEDSDKLIPLFDDEDEKEAAAHEQAPKPPLTRRGSMHEIILTEDSPVISGCARPKMRRRGTMEEKIMQDGQEQSPYCAWSLILSSKSAPVTCVSRSA